MEKGTSRATSDIAEQELEAWLVETERDASDAHAANATRKARQASGKFAEIAETHLAARDEVAASDAPADQAELFAQFQQFQQFLAMQKAQGK